MDPPPRARFDHVASACCFPCSSRPNCSAPPILTCRIRRRAPSPHPNRKQHDPQHWWKPCHSTCELPPPKQRPQDSSPRGNSIRNPGGTSIPGNSGFPTREPGPANEPPKGRRKAALRPSRREACKAAQHLRATLAGGCLSPAAASGALTASTPRYRPSAGCASDHPAARGLPPFQNPDLISQVSPLNCQFLMPCP